MDDWLGSGSMCRNGKDGNKYSGFQLMTSSHKLVRDFNAKSPVCVRRVSGESPRLPQPVWLMRLRVQRCVHIMDTIPYNPNVIIRAILFVASGGLTWAWQLFKGPCILPSFLPLKRSGDGSSPAEMTGLQDEGTRRVKVSGESLAAAVRDGRQPAAKATQ
jgi:hypothetical protein